MKKAIWATSAVAALGLLAAGCATKDYVKGEVKTVDKRVDTVESQVEQAQTQLKDHDQRITTNAQDTQKVSKTAQEALDRAISAGKVAQGKFLYETVLSDDKVRFGVNVSELSDEAKKALDTFATDLKGKNQNVYIEIQGHTDGTGGDEFNYQLGEKRAESARRYLSLKGGIALNRMSVISYGKTAPVADNKTRDGRAQNRRVVLVVLM